MNKEKRLKGIVLRNADAWNALSAYLKNTDISKVFILCDDNTHVACLPLFLDKLHFKLLPQIVSFPAGETHKTIHTCLEVWEKLSENGADRNSVIINLGGGVVTDLGGFVASTFKRGLRFINIPTSLLAMVDASVGGKNGVDLGHVKNQIGVINLPEMVVLDTEFLKTLASEHITSGLAEMLKHGIISNMAYWERIKRADFSKKEDFEDLIWDSIEIKKEIVSQDPFEVDLRKTLNYGHTLGHAIESYFMDNSDKKELLHGEAVAVGIILATYISKEMYNFPIASLKDISESILKHFPKQVFTKKDIEAIIKLLVFDKKNRNGKVLFVLMEDIGKYKTDCLVNNDLIYRAFSYYKNL